MPITIPDALPAKIILENENIFVMGEGQASHQDIRPLRLLILNLMPKKIDTETQLLRLLSNSPLQIEIDLLQTVSHKSKNTSASHLLKFYKTFDEIKHEKYDGMIITGAPVELLEFEEVDYWKEICLIMNWSKTHVFSTFHICWGAQAGLYYHYGIKKHVFNEKLFGIFEHRVLNPTHKLLRGFDEKFYVPHSRHTGFDTKDILACPDLELLCDSEIAGAYIIASRDNRNIFVTGHSEYDRDTLANEYFRDIDRGLDIKLPYNYFPDNDPGKKPVFNWRSHASLLYGNWLNYFVYQATPFNLEKL